jgi:hypothetical protein
VLNAAIWPTLDYSRVFYRLYQDPEAYQGEQVPEADTRRPRRGTGAERRHRCASRRA